MAGASRWVSTNGQAAASRRRKDSTRRDEDGRLHLLKVPDRSRAVGGWVFTGFSLICWGLVLLAAREMGGAPDWGTRALLLWFCLMAGGRHSRGWRWSTAGRNGCWRRTPWRCERPFSGAASVVAIRTAPRDFPRRWCGWASLRSRRESGCSCWIGREHRR